ncbi:MAG TPA: hypothetical protein VLH84_01325 [Patescibacteria group bacterium]|nr:hypothetical protein [Patescibacteria group bacterium]
MFGHRPFADLVAQGAQNSLGSEELCREFTRAMDQFADNYGDIAQNWAENFRVYREDVDAARNRLQRLIALQTRRPFDPEQDSAQFEDLWTGLQLRYRESVAVEKPRREQQIIYEYRDPEPTPARTPVWLGQLYGINVVPGETVDFGQITANLTPYLSR